MKLAPGQLAGLTLELSSRAELGLKQDIQLAAKAFGRKSRGAWLGETSEVLNGDDAAALRAPDGSYVLFAAEGMRADFVAADPWFAGYCAVMVNVSDIAAMGGRPWAVVDVLFLGSGANERVLEGMQAASVTFGVPVVGGHTTRVEGPTQLAAAIVGRARRLIESHTARPGQLLVAAIDVRGSFRNRSCFNAATTAAPEQLRAQLGLLPELAESGRVRTGKDVSNAGVCGTLLMLLEASHVGAVLDLGDLPAPAAVDPLRWLTAFPSYGFLLAVDPEHAAQVCDCFHARDVAAAVVGEVTAEPRLVLASGPERALFRDLEVAPLTGFGGAA
ncbi:MAG TPA: sll0787 family AIR synthase-like protein [Polyangiaceae bacterium]|nr:sll0787 family AIR synthase-like protein [Polyangiaceae bacterium]